MRSITILVPENAVPASVADARYMFSAVNSFFQQAGKEEPFRVKLAGMSHEVKLLDGQFCIHPDALLEDIFRTDLIIIPAIGGDIEQTIRINKPLINWVKKMHSRGSEAASLCTGAFLLAATDLLKGKSCSTHWLFSPQFRFLFPEVNLVDDVIITDVDGLYSSGGANTLWNLLLYLVEKYTNRETAIMASKYFLLDIGRNSQSDFVMFSGQKNHGDYEVVNVQEFLERKFTARISVDDLCEKFGMSRRTIERRFKKATGNSILEYLQRVRVESAKKQLELGNTTIQEIVYDSGYNDMKAFRDIFKKYTGKTPLEYRNKFRKAEMVA